jgi:hypothetical protein
MLKYPVSLDPSERSDPEEKTHSLIKVILPLLKENAETSPSLVVSWPRLRAAAVQLGSISSLRARDDADSAVNQA